MAHDKANLDITWLRTGSLEDLDNLPAPVVFAIVEDLAAALVEFEPVAAALEAASAPQYSPPPHLATPAGHFQVSAPPAYWAPDRANAD